MSWAFSSISMLNDFFDSVFTSKYGSSRIVLTLDKPIIIAREILDDTNVWKRIVTQFSIQPDFTVWNACMSESRRIIRDGINLDS